MIKVAVELYPFGKEESKKTLGTAFITNEGTGTKTKGNYNIKLHNKGSKKIWKKGRILDFKRLKKNSWDLLYLCLEDVIGNKRV